MLGFILGSLLYPISLYVCSYADIVFVLISPCLNYHVFLFSFEAVEKAGFWFCSFAILGPVYFYVTLLGLVCQLLPKRQMGFF